MTLAQFLLIQVNLTAFYLIALWLTNGKRHLTFNRYFLLLAPILAIVLPFLDFNSNNTGNWVMQLETVQVLNTQRIFETSVLSAETLVVGTGVLLFILVLIFQLIPIIRPHKAVYHSRYKNARVYVLSDKRGSHAFFNRIYLQPDHLENAEVVLAHEYAHCRDMHSIDVILMALLKAVFWFNPVIYLWNKLVRENHEFIADQSVMKLKIAPARYGELLLEMTFNQKVNPLTHTFNRKSTLRKRIENLTLKNQYQMKQIMIAPVLLGLLFLSMSLSSETEAQPPVKNQVVNHENPETQPEYPGGQKAMYAYISEELVFPESLKNEEIDATVYVEFTVKANGKVKNVTVKRSSNYEAIDEVAVRIVENMPTWTPGKKDGKAVDVKMTLPFKFQTKA